MIRSSSSLALKEAKNLATYAVKSLKGGKRRFHEKDDGNRLCFQKDKERIIHSKAFRRLDNKTQVFGADSGDHYRTRLTHTLEVAQISRDLARRLGLNEDLAETIALAHDLGHSPFGHAGEDALNRIMKRYGGHFEHNEQSRRVVEVLEKSYPEFAGLNLTMEVLDGLIKHQTSWDQVDKKFEISAHLEAQIVNIADEIAYTNHDIDDGLRSGLITLNQLSKRRLWKVALAAAQRKHGKIKDEDVLISRTISAIISMMIGDLCMQTNKNIRIFKIKSVNDVRKQKKAIACFSMAMQKMVKEMRIFLYKNFYMQKEIAKMTKRGERMIERVFSNYMKNSEKLPKKFFNKREPLQVIVKDYIAGMTDNFLLKEYEKLIIR
ncbi:MAG: deoxyguanosinetriphosphate triphosphohydrolase [Candidatus Gracilibacteria bacterium]